MNTKKGKLKLKKIIHFNSINMHLLFTHAHRLPVYLKLFEDYDF